MDYFPNGERIDRSKGEWGIAKWIRGEEYIVLRDRNGNVGVYTVLAGGLVGSLVVSFFVVTS